MEYAAQCVVCERYGHWAAAMRWHQGTRPFSMTETRSLIDARATMLQAPASVLLIETTPANAEGVLRLTIEARRTCPAARIIVLLERDIAALEPLFLECGALWAVLSPRRMDRIVRLVKRHLVLHEPVGLTTRKWVWSRLPWDNDQPGARG